MSENNELRIAVLGVGLMGAYHAKTLTEKTKGARVSVVNDFALDRAEKVAADIPGARAVADPFEAIAADDVDAVLIATPGPAHEEQLLTCIDHGKPVLCEKPLTSESESAYQVVQKEAATGRRLIQVGFMRRYDEEYAALRKLVVDGELGRPLTMHCVHRNAAVHDYFTAEMMVNDAAVHEVDVTRFLLGEEITAVQVLKPAPSGQAPAGLNDPLVIIFETAAGQIVTVDLFVCTGVGYEVRTELVAERGSAQIGLDQNLVRKTTDGRWGGQITADFVERFGRAYDTELQRWVDAARNGTADGPAAWDGYAAAAVCEAGIRSLHTGQRIEVKMEARP